MGTPFQGMSSFVQRVTQWMSLTCSRAPSCHHAVERQAHRFLDQAEDAEVPCRQVDARDAARLQHRPLVGVVLAGRDARLVDAGLPGLAILAGTKQRHATSGFETKGIQWHGRGESFHPIAACVPSTLPGVTALLDRSCIEATGPDAGVLLQSLLSNDVDGAQPGGAVYALLLTPKARVISDVELFNTGHGYVLACPPDRAQLVLESILRARFRRKVELAPSTHAVVWGEADDALASLETPAGPHRLLASAPDGVEPGRCLGGGAGRGRPARLRPRVRRGLDAGRGRAGAARRQLHEGLLPGAGAGRPAPVPRPCEPRAARARVERGAARAGSGRAAR